MELQSPLSPAEIVKELATTSRASRGAAGSEEIELEPGAFQGHINQKGFIVVLRPNPFNFQFQFVELAGRLLAGERGTRINLRARMSVHGKVVIALFFLATLGLVLVLPKQTWKPALLLLLVLLVYPFERLRAVARLRRVLRA